MTYIIFERFTIILWSSLQIHHEAESESLTSHGKILRPEGDNVEG